MFNIYFKIVSILSTVYFLFKQYNCIKNKNAEVAKLVDALDLGSSA